MPIRGLTDNNKARLPLAGRLRKGGPKTHPKKPGPDLTYFRFVGEMPHAEGAWHASFPPEPKRVAFYVPHETPEKVFQTWYEEWGANGMRHRCDGEWIVQERTDDAAGKYTFYEPGEKRCPYADDPDAVKEHRVVGRMEMIIPELVAEGIVGVVLFVTHSKWDVKQIWAALNKVYDWRGNLEGVRFILWRQMTQISTPPWEEGGARRKTTKSLVYCAPEQDWVKAQLEQQQAAAYGLLPEPSVEADYEDIVVDEETGEIIEAEASVVVEELPRDEVVQMAKDELGAEVVSEGEAELEKFFGPRGEPVEEYIEQADPDIPPGGGDELPEGCARSLNFGKHKGESVVRVYQDDPGYVYWMEKCGQPDWERIAKDYLNYIHATTRPWDLDRFLTELRAIWVKLPHAHRAAALSESQRGVMAGIMQQVLDVDDRKNVLEALYGVRSVKNSKLTWAHLEALMRLVKDQNAQKLTLNQWARVELKRFAQAERRRREAEAGAIQKEMEL